MTEYSFTERADYEVGFAEVHAREIAPFLRRMEVERQAVLARAAFRLKLAGAVTLLLAFAASYYVDPFLGIFPLFFGGAGCLILYLERGGKLKDQITGVIRPVLADFLEGIDLMEKVPDDFMPFDTMRNLSVIPTADRTRVDLPIVGEWRGVGFRLVRAHLSNRRRDSDGKTKTDTLFSGILLRIECPVDMPRVVFMPDFGKTLNRLYGWATRANRPPHKFEMAPDVEEVFEVYTDDVAEAEKHLRPGFGRLLLDISEAHQGARRHVSAAFRGHYFYLALKLPHRFLSFDVVHRPLSESEEQIHEALADMTIPRRIIDRLLDE